VASKTVIYPLAILLLLAAGVFWFLNRSQPVNPAVPLTAEAKAYVRNLQLSGVTMKATSSYVQQTVTEIEGKITNAGARAVKQADVYCIFYNVYGEVVRRERVPIVNLALNPGESRPFRLPFDDIPASWNNQMPQLVIARIEFR
jgi:hypothetical protein